MTIKITPRYSLWTTQKVRNVSLPHWPKRHSRIYFAPAKSQLSINMRDYHWLLLYEVLKNFTEVFNDEPEGVVGGKELVTKYGRKKVDFHDFIDYYFWDTDFLADPDGMINMGHESRQSMGLNQEAYAVIQRWAPHPEELELKKIRSAANSPET